VHKKLIGKATALHPSLSHEYAALTTLMWSARLIPMSLYRMRFGLNQIECNFPPDKSLRKEKISERNGAVRGIYIHSQQNVSDEKDRKVLFWLYGGAFLAGDCVGNLGLAESVAKAVNCDVYVCGVPWERAERRGAHGAAGLVQKWSVHLRGSGRAGGLSGGDPLRPAREQAPTLSFALARSRAPTLSFALAR
jgi:hypothetical protein